MVGKKELDSKKYIIKGFLLFLIGIGLLVFFFIRSLLEIGIIMESKCKVMPITFLKDDITLYIVMRDYGLNLQYCHTIISKNKVSSEDVAIDHKTDIVREGIDRLYYRVKQPDSLLILEPSWNAEVDFYDIEGIHVMIKGIKEDSLKNCVSQWEYKLLELYNE